MTRRELDDLLVREVVRARSGKLAGTRPWQLALNIHQLAMCDDDEKREQEAWLGPELLDLVKTDRRTFRQVADALDQIQMRKPGEILKKRHKWLRAYLKAYSVAQYRRPPTWREITGRMELSVDEKKRANEERSGRKLFYDIGLPMTNVPTGRPKGAKDGVSARTKNSERFKTARSLLLRHSQHKSAVNENSQNARQKRRREA